MTRPRRVLVTGAASGLGAALAAAFRARGDEVLATDLPGAGFETGASAPSSTSDPSVVEEVAQQPSRNHGDGSGGGASSSSSVVEEVAQQPSRNHGDGSGGGASSSSSVVEEVAQQPSRNHLALDVTSDADWAAALAHVEQTWGGLDILVNNAGVAGGGRLDVATMDEWEWITGINLFGAVRGTRTFVPMLKRQRSGHVVNVASLAGLVHPAGMASYNAVKAAVVALTETTGHELAAYGVRASVVCPSYFRTDLMSSMRGADEAVGTLIAKLVETSPVTADDIAREVLAGIDRGEELIVPDPAARQAWDLKRRDRPAYDAVMRAQAAKLEEAT